MITKSVFNTKILFRSFSQLYHTQLLSKSSRSEGFGKGLLLLLIIIPLSALKAHALPLKNLEKQLVRSHLDLKSMDAEMTSLNLQKESQESLFAPKINFKTGWANKKKPEVNNDGPVAYGQISWNLFNGGKDYKTITRTEKQKNILGLNTELEKNKVILQLRKLLIEQSFLQQEKHLLHASHQEHELHIQALKKKIHSGLSLDLELVRFELDVTKMELAENELIQKIRANELEIESLLVAKNAQNKTEDLLADENFQTEFAKIQWNQPQQKTLQQSLMEANIDMTELDADLEIRDIYPKLDFDFKYGAIEPNSGLSMGQISDRFRDYETQFLLTLPLYDGGSQGKKQKSILAKKSAEEFKLFHWKQSQAQALEANKNQILMLQSQLSILQKALSQSKKLYDKTKQAFQAGLKDSQDLMDSYVNWRDVQSQWLQNKKDLFEKASELELTYYYPLL